MYTFMNTSWEFIYAVLYITFFVEIVPSQMLPPSQSTNIVQADVRNVGFSLLFFFISLLGFIVQ